MLILVVRETMSWQGGDNDDNDEAITQYKIFVEQNKFGNLVYSEYKGRP